jgi:hypothetical protein
MATYDPWVAEQAHERARAQRGEFLDLMSSVEFHLEIFLANAYGIPSFLTLDAASSIFSRLGLDAKTQILRELLSLNGMTSEVLGELGELTKVRNMLAHSPALTSDGTFVNGAVYYWKKKGGRRYAVAVTFAEMDSYIRRAGEINPVFAALESQIVPDLTRRRRLHEDAHETVRLSQALSELDSEVDDD